MSKKTEVNIEGNVGCGCMVMLLVLAGCAASCALLGMACKFAWYEWSK